MTEESDKLFDACEVMEITFNRSLSRPQVATAVRQILDKVVNSDVSEVRLCFSDMVVPIPACDLTEAKLKGILERYALAQPGPDLRRG